MAYKDFQYTFAKSEVVKSNDKFVARYLSGLRLDLQNKLREFYFLIVEQIVPKVKAFDNQAITAAHRFQSAPQVG